MAKSQFSLLGTVPDGVKSFFLTASRVIQEVEVDKVRDDPEQFCHQKFDTWESHQALPLEGSREAYNPHQALYLIVVV